MSNTTISMLCVAAICVALAFTAPFLSAVLAIFFLATSLAGSNTHNDHLLPLLQPRRVLRVEQGG